ncbi:MAG: magnesium/cobalt transporter CorA [Nitrospira sp.]|nr:magnesium/cobalt transporter CorA [Nitrospira sp.]MCW5793946.1 magnesium/cobalt transporter CorA [Nitrospira sp.]
MGLGKMLSAFVLEEGRVIQAQIDDKDDLTRKDLVWVDLAYPSEEERELVQSVFPLELPDDEELQDLEASARYYQDQHGIHIRSTFVQTADDVASIVNMSFSLHQGRLLTVHDDDLSLLRLFRMQARSSRGMVRDAADILLSCYELGVERDADVLERIYTALDEVGTVVLSRKKEITSRIMRDNVERIAAQEDLNSKVRLDLIDNRRALSFLLRSRVLSPDQAQRVKGVLRDIDSLNGHTGFIFDKINFLMDALLGMINLEQNKIIKIFSIAAVVFLPPTLVASIYGMNFEHMPEMKWPLGYPMALLLMVFAGGAPYLYFRQKGWLD